MARTIRFHLDENCHRAIAEGLRPLPVFTLLNAPTSQHVRPTEVTLELGLTPWIIEEGRIFVEEMRAKAGPCRLQELSIES